MCSPSEEVVLRPLAKLSVKDLRAALTSTFAGLWGEATTAVYVDAIAANKWCGADLVGVTDADLESVGVPNAVHRRTLLRTFASYAARGVPVPSPTGGGVLSGGSPAGRKEGEEERHWEVEGGEAAAAPGEASSMDPDPSHPQ